MSIGAIALWALAVLLMIVGLIGTVMPALPGVVLVFVGIVLGAWIGNFEVVGTGVVIAAGGLTAASLVIDYLSQILFARRAGASRAGLIGAAIGTVAGIMAGLVGLLLFPLVGAAVGEMMAHQDIARAGRVGMATWVGLMVATVLKLAIVFLMIGLFVVALWV
ncbi:MAG TPA: DUF456 domain-containing protein [Burkholderiaceae bacterium]|nr:DUF456 domain-containing protein [Burkholderiaceae bacterium]